MLTSLWKRACGALVSLVLGAGLAQAAPTLAAPTGAALPASSEARSVPPGSVAPQIDFHYIFAAGQAVDDCYNTPNRGSQPYTGVVTAGSMPPGVTTFAFIGQTVCIRGTPTATGVFVFTFEVRDSTNTPLGYAELSYTINPPNLALSPAAGPVATSRINIPGYSQQFTASGGTAPYTYSVFSGALPSGLTLDPSTGVVSGQPTLAGIHNFTIRATDSTTGSGAPFSITRAYQITIYDTVVVTTASPLPNAQIGVPYSVQLAASGGDGGPYVWSLANAVPAPAGLTLSSTGLLSGTPTEAGPFVFYPVATDQGGFNGAKIMQLGVAPPTIDIQPATLNNATVGVLYAQTLAAAGGTGPYTYLVTAGSLPAGVTLLQNGVLSGAPTAGGTFNFTVTATDSSTGVNAPFSSSRAYVWTVQGPTMTMTPASGTLPGGQQFVPYTTQTFSASGGIAPYSYTVFSGSLPAGLTFSAATGQLSGTPTAFGAFTFAIRATDSATGTGPYTVTNTYTLNIQQAVPIISTIAPTNGTAAGGTVVTITGTNFQNVSAVSFGGTAAAYTVVNATTISATTPAHAAGVVDVVVTTPGGTATLAGGYTYVAPGSFQFVVNSGDDDGSFTFSVPGASNLTVPVTTSGGSGASAVFSVQPGNYPTTFTVPDGFGLAGGSCSPSTSTVNTSARTIALIVASNVTTVCTIEALGNRRATVELIGAALDASSRLILSNAPDLSRRLARLNGGGGSGGTASAFGKTFASGLPFSATIADGQMSFAMSLSDLRAEGDADHRFVAPNGVPASLAASSEAASAAGVIEAASGATAALASNRANRFDVWVEGMLAAFSGAASSDGHFAIVHAGMDYLVTDDVLFGVAIQGDWLDMDTAGGALDSSGWLAGPYLTARFSENLYLDLRAAWGGASLEVSPFGTYTDTVTSDRELYSAALIGAFDAGNLTIRPEARVTWYKETTDAYIDSLSVAIPSVEIKTGEITIGPTFAWTVERANGGILTPTIRFDLVWTFEQDNAATAFTAAPGLDDTGVRGRIETGVGYTSAGGVSVGGSVFYDGIGGGDYEAWGGKASIRFGF